MFVRSFILFLSLGSSALFAETPQEALKRLIQGNQNFAQDRLTYPERNSERRAAIVSTQDPFAIILGCSDSRVPIELVFDQSVGDLFIVRIAGNVLGKTEFESINYSVTHHNPKVIMVLGHEGCGAVKAVLNNDTQGVETIANLIQPSVDKARKEKGNQLEKAVKENVCQMVHKLNEVPLIAKLVKEQKIIVVGGYYALSSGVVEIMPCSK
jgi:carbonic anhydrase